MAIVSDRKAQYQKEVGKMEGRKEMAAKRVSISEQEEWFETGD